MLAELIDTRMTMPLAIEIAGGPLGRASAMPCPVYNLPTRACHVGDMMRAKSHGLRHLAGLLKAEGRREEAAETLRQARAILCGSCYADRGKFSTPVVVNAAERHLQALDHPRWVEALAYLINAGGNRYFRWHSSGDLQSLAHFEQLCEVARLCPDVSFWLPTKELGLITRYKRLHGGEVWPDNLSVNWSHPIIDPLFIPAQRGRIGLHIVVRHAPVPEGVYECPKHTQGNHCGTCRHCWSEGPVNAFTWH